MKNCLCWGKATPAQPLPGTRREGFAYQLSFVPRIIRGGSFWGPPAVPAEEWLPTGDESSRRVGEGSARPRESPREANTESAVAPSTQLGAEGKRDYRPALGRCIATVSPEAILT